jgi:regulator of protease activity HflC (stomatin/prohibitin superfamily)
VETALGWLGDIFRAVLRFIPQLIIVRATHAGIKFRHGSDVIQILHNNGVWRFNLSWRFPFIRFRRTGIHFIWPLVTEHEVVPIKRQTINLAVQYLCTKDGKKIGVGGIVVYEIDDVEKLLTECHDYDETIQDLSLSGIKKVITSHRFAYLLENSNKVDTELTRGLRQALARFGVKVIKVTLSDFAECRMLALWGANITVASGE